MLVLARPARDHPIDVGLPTDLLVKTRGGVPGKSSIAKSIDAVFPEIRGEFLDEPMVLCGVADEGFWIMQFRRGSWLLGTKFLLRLVMFKGYVLDLRVVNLRGCVVDDRFMGRIRWVVANLQALPANSGKFDNTFCDTDVAFELLQFDSTLRVYKDLCKRSPHQTRRTEWKSRRK